MMNDDTYYITLLFYANLLFLISKIKKSLTKSTLIIIFYSIKFYKKLMTFYKNQLRTN